MAISKESKVLMLSLVEGIVDVLTVDVEHLVGDMFMAKFGESRKAVWHKDSCPDVKADHMAYEYVMTVD